MCCRHFMSWGSEVITSKGKALKGDCFFLSNPLCLGYPKYFFLSDFLTQLLNFSDFEKLCITQRKKNGCEKKQNFFHKVLKKFRREKR
jgi:hypothetical protein